MMEQRDNPHAKGLSVNEDVMIEDAYVPTITWGGTSLPYAGGHVEAAQIEYRIEQNYRSGLALTNPEE